MTARLSAADQDRLLMLGYGHIRQTLLTGCHHTKTTAAELGLSDS